MDVEENQQNRDNMSVFVILKNGERVEVDGRFRRVSNLIHDLSETNMGEDIPITQISSEMLTTILDYCRRHNWNPPKVKRPVQTNSLKDNLTEQDYLFIKDYQIGNKDTRLNDLLTASYYLQIQTLYDVAICRIATEYFFGSDQASFDELKKKHNITDDLTIEQEEKIHKDFPWI